MKINSVLLLKTPPIKKNTTVRQNTNLIKQINGDFSRILGATDGNVISNPNLCQNLHHQTPH